MARKAKATPAEELAVGRREAARIVLDHLADSCESGSARLAGLPNAVAALNEATAILRDAARDEDYVPVVAEAVDRPAETVGPETPAVKA